MPKSVYGGQIYSMAVDITNIGDTAITNIEVDPQLIPGVLIMREETDNQTEKDKLEEKKRRIFREMEQQVSKAYEMQRYRKLSLPEKIAYSYASMPEVLASSITGLKISTKLFTLPSWSTEALKISSLDDIDRVEAEFISSEAEDSLIRKCFDADKHKLKKILQDINAANTEEKPNSDEHSGLQTGNTISFTFRYRAPNLYRQQTFDCQFRISFQEVGSSKVGNATAAESITFFASAFAVPLGSVIGAIAGYAIKTSLMANIEWFSRQFFTELIGCTVLAVIFGLITSKSPETKKSFTVEDFVGGVVLGAIASMFSADIIALLRSFVPGNPPS